MEEFDYENCFGRVGEMEEQFYLETNPSDQILNQQQPFQTSHHGNVQTAGEFGYQQNFNYYPTYPLPPHWPNLMQEIHANSQVESETSPPYSSNHSFFIPTLPPQWPKLMNEINFTKPLPPQPPQFPTFQQNGPERNLSFAQQLSLHLSQNNNFHTPSPINSPRLQNSEETSLGQLSNAGQEVPQFTSIPQNIPQLNTMHNHSSPPQQFHADQKNPQAYPNNMFSTSAPNSNSSQWKSPKVQYPYVPFWTAAPLPFSPNLYPQQVFPQSPQFFPFQQNQQGAAGQQNQMQPSQVRLMQQQAMQMHMQAQTQQMQNPQLRQRQPPSQQVFQQLPPNYVRNTQQQLLASHNNDPAQANPPRRTSKPKKIPRPEENLELKNEIASNSPNST